MLYPRLSELIFALEQIKEINEDKEVLQLTINDVYDGDVELYVEFSDYTSHTIELKNRD